MNILVEGNYCNLSYKYAFSYLFVGIYILCSIHWKLFVNQFKLGSYKKGLFKCLGNH